MATTSSSLAALLILTLFSWPQGAESTSPGDFLRCAASFATSPPISGEIYTPANISFLTLLQSTMFNFRFISSTTPKPSVIVTPSTESQIRAVVLCAQKHDLLLKIRSGGHDFEGISYTSQERPFVLLDMRNISAINVDVKSETAWIQVGASLGQVYYTIASKSPTLAFPAGVCPTVGAGGHISGGGYGMMIRMYGMAADNVIDARVVLADGRVVDRKAMGEDLFWAIRGGGSSGFGVILAWRVQLVKVPPTVTVFTVNRRLSHNATGLVHKWQLVAHTFPNELTLDVLLSSTDDGPNETLTVKASFFALYLGRTSNLLQVMTKSFPELGLTSADCSEMRWIESVLYFSRLPRGVPLERMLSRNPLSDQSFYKIKLDYFKKPIPMDGLVGMWKKLFRVEAGVGFINLVPYGGRMDQVSSMAIPYPHRAGNLFHAFYYVTWLQDEGSETTNRRIDWVREIYNYMTPYASASPRGSYVNYRDLELGVNPLGRNTSYRTASVWGRKYFEMNFDRLVRVKTKFDPRNFFRSEQSIPSLAAVH